MSDIYIASFSYGKASLTGATLVKESDKSYMIEPRSTERVFGWEYIPRRLSKDKYHCFSSAQEAISFLITMADRHVKRCRLNMDEAIKERERLMAIMEKVEER